MNLSRHAEAKAMSCWFEAKDLPSMQQWFYVAARLEMLVYRIETDPQGPGEKTFKLRHALLSNNKSVIDWFSRYDAAYDRKREEDRETHDFWAYLAMVALRGEWPRLLERCERVLVDQPGANREQSTSATSSPTSP